MKWNLVLFLILALHGLALSAEPDFIWLPCEGIGVAPGSPVASGEDSPSKRIAGADEFLSFYIDRRTPDAAGNTRLLIITKAGAPATVSIEISVVDNGSKRVVLPLGFELAKHGLRPFSGYVVSLPLPLAGPESDHLVITDVNLKLTIP